MVKWNRFDTDCKNEWDILTRWISFTGPLSGELFSELIHLWTAYLGRLEKDKWKAKPIGIKFIPVEVISGYVCTG